MCSNIDICYVILFPVLTPNHTELVAQIRQIRMAQGITASKLSMKVFGEGNSISAIENGRKRIYILDFLKMCHVLRVSPMRLIAACDDSKKAKSLSANQKTLVRGRPRKVSTVYAQDIQPQDVGDKP